MIQRIAELVALAPQRPSGSPGERRAQEHLSAQLQAAGLAPTWHAFTFRSSLYAYMALEFGLAALGLLLWLVSPWLAALVHGATLISWLGHATRRYPPFTRWLLPRRSSSNLIATKPATAPLRQRLVLMAHADAAWTGWIFEPGIVRLGAGGRQMVQLSACMLGLVVLDVGWGLMGGGWAAWVLGVALSLPLAVAALMNLQVVLQREVVPGAADNLSGCVGATVLAEQLSSDLPDDVELIVVITGAEEAGTCGSMALVGHVDWEPERTVVLNLDGLTNGRPQLIREGEVLPVAPDLHLEALALSLAQELDMPLEPRLIAAGATDALALRLAGHRTLSLVCIDPDLGTPLHYHHRSDSPDNLDPGQLDQSVEFLLELARRVSKG